MLGNVWESTADWHADDDYAHCSYRNWSAASTRYTLVGIRLVMQDPATH